jgi:multidrug efflux pump subunit AcrB
MRGLLTWFIKYPTWANVIKILIMIFGLMALLNMKTSFFTELDSNMISITVVYPGASPEEIEQGVVQKIEDNLKGIQGIDRYSSTSQENFASIMVEVFRSYDIGEVLMDVKNAVERINSFPQGIEPPVVAKTPASEFAISFGITGPDDLNSLKATAKMIEYDLRAISGISQIAISGYPEEEIVAYVRDNDLRTYGITIDDVTRALRMSNVELTAGTIKTENEEIIIRLNQKHYFAESLTDIPVLAMPDGRVVRLRDIAEIRNTWEDNPKRTFINGKRAVVFTINKIVGENILEITENVRLYVEEFDAKNTNFQAMILNDFTESLRKRIDTLMRNGTQGAMLVLLALALFLNFRLAFWVSLAIPLSFLGMFLVGYIFGMTINAISLFGCIVVVGILVDDGIVIAEQIYQYYEQGKKPFVAAIEGTLAVLPSVVFAVLTTVVMFLPFLFLDGRSGAAMRDMGFVVIFALIFSLIEAAIILPSHLAHSKALHNSKSTHKIRLFLDNLLAYPRDVFYRKSLDFFLRFRLIAIGILILITIVTFGGISGGHIKFTFFPYIDTDAFDITLAMPSGTRDNLTEEVMNRIEKAAWEVNDELKSQREDGKNVIKYVIKKVASGASFTGGMGLAFSSVATGSDGVIQIVLMNGEERNLESFKIANEIREKVGPVYEADKLLFAGGSIFGKPISFSLVSPNLEHIEKAKEELKAAMQNMSEIDDVSDNDPQGLREVRVKLKEKAFLLGLTNADIARRIRQGFFGDEVQRLQRGDDEIKVWVRYSDSDRSNLGKFENIRIRLPNGNEYPLGELIDYEIVRGKTVINHIDGKREVTVSADIVDQNAEVPPILERIRKEVLEPIFEKYPGVTTVESGQRREVLKMANTGKTGLSIAFVIMYFLVVLSFRSFTQAAVVFALLPFGLIGAFWGHFTQATPVNIMSVYGLIALVGILVNNSIVYTNTFNGYLKDGMNVHDALLSAGVNRFRPILLTTATTVLGLFPLLAERSLQAKFLIPMAISVAYGLLVGSVFVLVYLPVFLSLLNDARRIVRRIITGNKVTPEEVEPSIIEEKKINLYMN